MCGVVPRPAIGVEGGGVDPNALLPTGEYQAPASGEPTITPANPPIQSPSTGVSSTGAIQEVPATASPAPVVDFPISVYDPNSSSFAEQGTPETLAAADELSTSETLGNGEDLANEGTLSGAQAAQRGEVSQADFLRDRRASLRFGRGSTLLTGGLGLGASASLSRPTLLGA